MATKAATIDAAIHRFPGAKEQMMATMAAETSTMITQIVINVLLDIYFSPIE